MSSEEAMRPSKARALSEIGKTVRRVVGSPSSLDRAPAKTWRVAAMRALVVVLTMVMWLIPFALPAHAIYFHPHVSAFSALAAALSLTYSA